MSGKEKQTGMPSPVWFMGKAYTDSEELTGAIAGAWSKESLLRLLEDDTDTEFSRLLAQLMSHSLLGACAKSIGLPEETVQSIKHAEKYFNKENSAFKKSKIRILLYGIISQKKTFVFDTVSFRSLKDLAEYLQAFADSSKSRLQSKIRPLFLDGYNLDPAFEAWLLNLGYERAVSMWNEKYQVGFAEEAKEDLPEGGSDQAGIPDAVPEAFAEDSRDFEPEFLKMLMGYPEVLEDTRKFTGLLLDLFPQNPMQARLMDTLYKMDIVQAIRDAKSLNEMFTLRFVRRLTGDFGVREDYAKWAVAVWCVCYGEKLLKKECTVAVPAQAGIQGR